MLLKDRSFTNKKWILNDTYANFSIDTPSLAESLNISEYTLRVLLNRKIEISEIPHYINPKVKNFFNDPYVLDDMENACNIIINHLNNKNNIIILGDYDVDGITSTSILCQYLQKISANIYTYIPDRYKEGYGVTFKALENIYKLNPNLIILLDNGSVSYEEVASIRGKGIDVIVVDHHSVEFKPLLANAFVNPQKPNDTSGLNHLCSVGLTFMLIVALNRLLRGSEIYKQNNIDDIDTKEYLPLVALGTVCDMVPLHGINRAFIRFGIRIINNSGESIIRKMLNAIGLKEPISCETIGFFLGPCINAGSRMGQSNLPLRVLMSNRNHTIVDSLIRELINLNEERKKQEGSVVQHVLSRIDENNTSNIIFYGSEEYNSGILGIVAGRIKELYNKSTCIFSLNKDTGIATASGRSVEGVHLGNIILGGVEKGILKKGGGHSQAVGFSFEYSKLNEVQDFISKEVQKQANLSLNYNEQKVLSVDSIISLLHINLSLLEDMQKIFPFGIGFEEPIFLIQNVKISNIKIIGKDKNHVSLIISDGFKYKIKGNCFKCLPGSLGKSILDNENNFVDILVKLKINYYLGRKLATFTVLDIANP